jgi:hypothetical protein
MSEMCEDMQLNDRKREILSKSAGVLLGMIVSASTCGPRSNQSMILGTCHGAPEEGIA